MGCRNTDLVGHSLQERGEYRHGIRSFNRICASRDLLPDRTDIGLGGRGPQLECHATRSNAERCHVVLFSPIEECFGEGSAGSKVAQVGVRSVQTRRAEVLVIKRCMDWTYFELLW